MQNIIEKMQQYDNKHIYSVIDLSIDLTSEKYNSSKQKYIKRCCDDFKRTISYHLRNNEKTQDALKIETHLKDSQTIYFLYNYNTKVQYVSINCNHILRFATKPGQVKFFSDKQDAVEFAETLKNIHGINFQIDSYTYDGILTSYNYIFRLIKKESDALIKELNKDTMTLESNYFTSQYQFDEIKQLLNTHERIYIAFRKKINIHAQLMQLHDDKIPTCVNVKTIDFSQKELLFSSKITNSLLYAITKKDAEKIEKYMKSLDKSYVYRLCELTTKTEGA